MESIAQEYNNEVIIPKGFWIAEEASKDIFDRDDWLFLKRIAQLGPTTDTKISDVKVGDKKLNCMHKTQPKRNLSIFYRRIDTNCIMVIGVGRHEKTNKKYDVNWCDGTRKMIDLSKTNQNGSEYLANPIGGTFSFQTLDVVINKDFLEP
ncbi:hypothetical protein SMB34_12540 [Thalassospira permensis NBRC 106175]|uniref:Uncharacterized protein n=2 Tax=Thalassospira permensis TaxID=680197 RepID=A0ABR4TUU9_9PROT|nr:hypothetical protein SMB34_12540 [Thalassospira permensis NBRC 106175]